MQILFLLCTFSGVFLFYFALRKNLVALSIIIVLMVIQAILSNDGFFINNTSLPPRLPILILPSIFIILYCFFSKKGKQILQTLNYTLLNYFHLIRIPVEIFLFMLANLNLVPESMTFEGRNFDLFSGLTAGFISYFGFSKKTISKNLLITWNIICLALVLQVVVTGILSAPSPFQQLSFDQPNLGVLLFPYVWLPGIIVPMVVFAHLATLRKLIYLKD